MESKKRIEYIDGVKGLMWIPVFWGHFIQIFGIGHEIDFASYNVVFSFIHRILINGNAAVYIFLFFSTYLVSLRTINSNGNVNIAKSTVKRYLRFFLPLILMYELIYLSRKLGLVWDFVTSDVLQTGATFFPDVIPQSDILFDSFIGTIFIGKYIYCPPLWMIKFIFLGGILSMILAMLRREFKHGWVYDLALFIVVLALLYYDSFYSVCVASTLLADLHGKSYNKTALNIICIVGFIVALLLNAYSLELGVSAFMLTGLQQWSGIHFTGRLNAIIFGFALCGSTWLQKLFSAKPFTAMSKISFPIYLSHWIVMAVVGTISAVKLFEITGSLSVARWGSLVFVLVAIFVVSVLYTKFIEPLFNKISNKICNLIFN